MYKAGMLRTPWPYLTLSLLCVACSDASDPVRDGGPLDRDDSAVVQGDAGDAPESDAAQAVDAQTARDSAAQDSATAEDAAAQPDAGDAQAEGCQLPDVDPSCSGKLCKLPTGETWLSLYKEEPWYIGALEFTAGICERAIGLPRSRSNDGRTLGYRVAAQDIAELRAGTALQVAYAFGEIDPRTAIRCSFDASEPLADCAFEGTCNQNAMNLWNNLGQRPECLASCDGQYGVDPCFGAGSCDCWCSQRDLVLDLCPTLAQP